MKKIVILLLAISTISFCYGQAFFNVKDLTQKNYIFHKKYKERIKKKYRDKTFLYFVLDGSRDISDSLKIYIKDTLFTTLCLNIQNCNSSQGNVFMFKSKHKLNNVPIHLVLTQRKEYVAFKADFYKGTYLLIDFDENGWSIWEHNIRCILYSENYIRFEHCYD